MNMWYNLRNEDGQEIKVGNVDDLLEAQDKGYKVMSIVNLKETSKCKEG